MERQHGVLGITTDGVFFTESVIAGVQKVRHVHVEISRQNANLAEVRQRLAVEAMRAGCNAVMGFQYGQKAHSWWEQLINFKWDTESWHGSGDAIVLKSER